MEQVLELQKLDLDNNVSPMSSSNSNNCGDIIIITG
ncbi:MAG: class III lanthipeptide [Ruoffia tabacinasalis]|nr:class III lanthipeptide [Ruoffia tabacinasalis]